MLKQLTLAALTILGMAAPAEANHLRVMSPQERAAYCIFIDNNVIRQEGYTESLFEECNTEMKVWEIRQVAREIAEAHAAQGRRPSQVFTNDYGERQDVNTLPMDNCDGITRCVRPIRPVNTRGL